MEKRIRRVRKVLKPTPPKHRSFSQISKYMNCAHQYKLYYIEKIPIEGINLNFAVGKAGHSYIEQVLTARLKEKDMTPKQREECLMFHSLKMGTTIKSEIEKFKSKDLIPAIKTPVSELRRQLEALLKRWNIDVLPEIEPIGVEQELKIDIDGESFIMYIDLVQRLGKKEKAIIDWKFVKATKGDRAVSDSLQLSLYALASGIKNVGFCSLVKPQEGKEKNWKPRVVIKRAHRTTADIEFAKETIQGAVQGIRLGYFPKCSPENFLCTSQYCDYWPICRGKDKQSDPVWMG